MVKFSEAIKRPFSDLKKLSIGALMYLFPYLSIVTGFLGRGYTLGCAKSPSKGKLPDWKNFWQLFVRGFTAFVIGLIYALPFLIVLTALLSSVLAGSITENMTEEVLTEAITTAVSGMGTQLFLLVLLLLLTVYLIPMALMHYIQHYKFGDAFQFSSILQKAFTGKYLLTAIVVALYAFVLSFIADLLTELTKMTIVVPYIISAYLSIITSITTMTMFGQSYKELK